MSFYYETGQEEVKKHLELTNKLCKVPEWSGQKANRFAKRHTGHSKHTLLTTQRGLHMDITRWINTEIDWLLLNELKALW